MDPRRCVGGCVPMFVAGVALDVVGLVLLFVGIFADVRVDGRFYGDFLIYSGALVVFISLACWLMWYVGNVPLSEEGPRKRSSIARLARKLSERLSQKLRGDDDWSQGGAPARKAGRVTWGKSTAYHNEGYDDLDSPAEKKEEEKTEM